ncbi:MAG: hypothetical protein SV760_05640, partial [Halobacteria archaeon]|nr:hypothetical protein [Halobacteria archaeon]
METQIEKTGGGGETFLDIVIDTTGTKGIILVSYLVLVTLVSSVWGTRSLEGVLPGAVLVIALSAGLAFEKNSLDRDTDVLGVTIVGIAIVYTFLEALGIRQGLLFPLVSAGVLLGTVAYDSSRKRSTDLIEFLGSVDLVGLYGSILLVVYSLLYVGGQLSFIYSPYFPGFILAFVATVLSTSVGYMSRASKSSTQISPGELH